MKDIETRADIEHLLDTFYKKVIVDDLIGHFFTKIVVLDWDEHMPTMYNFWETTLFGRPKYKGNPMLKHLSLHKKSPLEPIHFERWLSLWKQTLNDLFKGEIADKALQRAQQIGGVMQFKVEKY